MEGPWGVLEGGAAVSVWGQGRPLSDMGGLMNNLEEARRMHPKAGEAQGSAGP